MVKRGLHLCTARRSNQSILKEISPEYSLEGLMLKLKLQYLGHLMWRTDSFEKTLMLGKIEGKRRRNDRGWDSWMVSPTQWTWVWASVGSWWWTGKAGLLQSTGLQRVGHDGVTELNWHLCTWEMLSWVRLHVWSGRCLTVEPRAVPGVASCGRQDEGIGSTVTLI